MNRRIGLALTLALLATSALPQRAAALPIALWNFDESFAISDTDRMIATYEGTGAGYSNDLFLMRDSFGNVADDGDLTNDLFLFNNHLSDVGSTFEIDNVTPGAELLFRLFVRDTGLNFYSGIGSRNPDGMTHALIQREWKPGTALVSFEDLYGLPEERHGFNDLSFSFRNTQHMEIPEPHTASLLLIGALGLIALRRPKVR